MCQVRQSLDHPPRGKLNKGSESKCQWYKDKEIVKKYFIANPGHYVVIQPHALFPAEGQIEGASEIQSSEGVTSEGINEETEPQTQESERAVAGDQEQAVEGALATVAEGDEDEQVEAEVPLSGDEPLKPVRTLINYSIDN